MDHAKDAAKAVLRTLTWVDFVSVVAFSTKVSYATQHLVPATEDNLGKLRTWIDALSPGGTTNYRDSLIGAMTMLKNAKVGTRSCCVEGGI